MGRGQVYLLIAVPACDVHYFYFVALWSPDTNLHRQNDSFYFYLLIFWMASAIPKKFLTYSRQWARPAKPFAGLNCLNVFANSLLFSFFSSLLLRGCYSAFFYAVVCFFITRYYAKLWQWWIKLGKSPPTKVPHTKCTAHLTEIHLVLHFCDKRDVTHSSSLDFEPSNKRFHLYSLQPNDRTEQ